MNKLISSKKFWIFSIVLAALIFALANMSGRGYRAETDILLLPKNPTTAKAFPELLADAVEIPRSLSFYDKLVENNEEIEDGFAALPQAKRKAEWNKTLSTYRLDGSGVVRFSVFSPSQFQASLVSERAARETAIVLSRYYNIKTDLEVRIIDGPVSRYENPNYSVAWLLISLLLGLAGGAVLFLIFSAVTAFQEYKAPSFPEIFSRPETARDIESEAEFFTQELERKKPVTEAEAATPGKKAFAPTNLPIGDELPASFFAPIKKTEIDFEKKPPILKTHEATPAEVRERLNRLLRGDM